MAALPYMQLYVADYLADTMHLTTEEQGAYLLLIFNYWQTGRAIPKARLARIARLSNERWTDVEQSLNEFFNDNGEAWVHERIERDLEAVHATQNQRSAAGKASAEARKNKNAAKPQRKGNARSTSLEIPLNENSTIRDTETDKDIKSPLSPLAEKTAPAPEPKAKRKTRLPEPFNLTADMRAWANDRAPAVDLRNETERFVNYWRGNGKTMVDWCATWRNWFLKAQDDANRRVSPPPRNGRPPLDMHSTAWAEEPIL